MITISHSVFKFSYLFLVIDSESLIFPAFLFSKHIRDTFRVKPGALFTQLMNAYALPLSGLMTARFLVNLRKWDHRMFNTETDQWDIHEGGEGGQLSAIQFKKSQPRTSQWTINDILGDDPLLKPVRSEVNPDGGSSTARDAST